MKDAQELGDDTVKLNTIVAFSASESVSIMLYYDVEEREVDGPPKCDGLEPPLPGRSLVPRSDSIYG